MNGNDTYLDVNNAHLRVTSGNVHASGFNLDQISIVTTSNTGSTINFLNDTKGFTSRSNIEVGTANLFVDTTTSRVGIGTDAPAYTLDVHGSANVGAITTTDINVTGNLAVLGTTTTVDTDNLRVKDPIIELGKGNAASPVVDLGLILTRPTGSSNVAIIYDESTDNLEIGYTQGNASQSIITMETAAANPISVNINGTISGNGSGLTALPAAQITGTLDAARIPALDTAKITTGTLDAARIPALDTAKITTGTLDAARIPTLNQNTTGSAGSATTAGTCSGNSATATTAGTLTTARSIGGVDFDGSEAIVPTTFGVATFSGDVGIGTTSPLSKLTIGNTNTSGKGLVLYKGSDNSIKVGDYLNIGHTLKSNFPFIGINADYDQTESQGSSFSGDNTWTPVASGSGFSMMVIDVNGGGQGSLTFNTLNHGTDTSSKSLTDMKPLLHLDAINTRVGIGTDSPQYRLDVGYGGGATAATDVMLRVMSSSGTSGKLIFGRSGTTDIRSHAIETYNSSGADNNYMKFLVHDGTGTAPYETRTEVMTLRGDGNVGIGTSSPESLLHVQPTSTNNAFIKAVRHNDLSSTKAIFAVSEYQMTGMSAPGTIIGNHNRDIHIGAVFSTGNVLDGTTDGIRITSAGNVGIGTTSPSGKLQVYDDTNTKSLLDVRAGSGTSARTDINTGIKFNGNSTETFSAGGSSNASRSYHIRFNSNRMMTLFYNGDDLKFAWGGGGSYADRASVGNSAEFGFTFTGQHRNFVKDVPFRDVVDKQMGGLIVCANNNEYVKISDGIGKGLNAITQNEALPVLSMSSKALDKSCFGVISESEDPNSNRTGTLGMFKSFYDTEDGDKRIIVNSVGEGAIWVTNINGPLESGDYITTSNVAGYGMKQESDSLKNYTVAKITMDCDFSPVTQPIQNIKKDETGENTLDEHGQLQWEDHAIETEKAYKIRYLDANGVITDEANVVHTAAFVGCTYHCG